MMLFASVNFTNALYVVLFSVVTVAVVLVAVWLISRFMAKKDEVVDSGENDAAVSAPVKKLNFTALMVMTLAIGFVVRLIFTFLSRGYRVENDVITSFMAYIQNHGFAGGYYTQYGVTIMPLTYYIFSFMGAFAELCGVGAESIMMPLFIKLPFIICDLVTAFVLYRFAKKYVNSYVALIMCALFSFFPLFIFASAVWGSMYSMLSLALVLVLYFVAKKNFAAIIGVYGAALLIDKSAMYLFPLVAVFVVYSFIKAIIAIKKLQPSGFKGIMSNKDCSMAIAIPLDIVVTTLCMYLVSLPTIINSVGGGFFTYFNNMFLQPLVDLDKFGTNSLGIFNIFMRNGKDLGGFPSVVFVSIFGVIITAITLLIYLSKKNRANLVFLGGYIIMTLATFFVDFSALSMLPVISIFMLSFIIIRDKRILQIVGALSLVMVINGTLSMASAGYLNNLTAEQIALLNPSIILSGGGGIATTIICSVVAILSHLYATLVLLDISMSNKRKLLDGSENVKFFKSIANWVKI